MVGMADGHVVRRSNTYYVYKRAWRCSICSNLRSVYVLYVATYDGIWQMCMYEGFRIGMVLDVCTKTHCDERDIG